MELGSHVASCILNASDFTSNSTKDVLSYVYLWTTEHKSGNHKLEIAASDGLKLVCFSPDIDKEWLKNNPINGILDLSDIKIPANMNINGLKFQDSKFFILSLSKKGRVWSEPIALTLELKPFPKPMPNFKDVINGAVSENRFNDNLFKAENYVDPEDTLNYVNAFKGGKNYLIGMFSDPANFGRALNYKVVKAKDGEYESGNIDINFKINCFYQNSNAAFSNQQEHIYANLDIYRQTLNQIIDVCGGKKGSFSTTLKIKKSTDPIVFETLSEKVSQLNIIMPYKH